MKTLSDGTEVSARIYYYLLDFNDKYRREYIQSKFNKQTLASLTINEFVDLFNHAIKVDKYNIRNLIK